MDGLSLQEGGFDAPEEAVEALESESPEETLNRQVSEKLFY